MQLDEHIPYTAQMIATLTRHQIGTVERDGIYKDLITGQEMEAAGVNVPAYGFFWLKKIN